MKHKVVVGTIDDIHCDIIKVVLLVQKYCQQGWSLCMTHSKDILQISNIFVKSSISMMLLHIAEFVGIVAEPEARSSMSWMEWWYAECCLVLPLFVSGCILGLLVSKIKDCWATNARLLL